MVSIVPLLVYIGLCVIGLVFIVKIICWSRDLKLVNLRRWVRVNFIFIRAGKIGVFSRGGRKISVGGVISENSLLKMKRGYKVVRIVKFLFFSSVI
jgi:hypothetical protein